jgi:hemoglobin-like flavoprotein
MMLVMVLVVALAGTAFGDDCCSAEDRREIEFIWHKIWASSFTDRKITIVKAVYAEFFNQFPEARALFKRVNIDNPDSPEYRAFLVRFATGIDTVINELDDTAVVAKQLEHLAAQHAAIDGIKKSYFPGLADAIEKVLPQVSSCFNVEAWHRCFRRIVNKISANLPE